MNSVVYCLTNRSESHTYVGVTSNLKRRLRQHNGEISGGARYTRLIRLRTGQKWRRLFVISNLPSRKVALQLEWRLHRRAAGAASNPFGSSATARRALQLIRALAMERVTKTAPLTSTLAPIISWRTAGYAKTAKNLPTQARGAVHGTLKRST